MFFESCSFFNGEFYDPNSIKSWRIKIIVDWFDQPCVHLSLLQLTNPSQIVTKHKLKQVMQGTVVKWQRDNAWEVVGSYLRRREYFWYFNHLDLSMDENYCCCISCNPSKLEGEYWGMVGLFLLNGLEWNESLG